MNFLVIGLGAIGQRHCLNLRELGHHVYTYDKDRAKMDLAVEKGFEILDFTARHLPVDGWVICTPPELHVGFAMKALERGCHVFIEKPISNALTGPEGSVEYMLSTAEKKNLTVMTGYQLRFSTGLLKLKGFIEKQTWGPLYHIYCEYGMFLPDWHPNENCLESYTAYTGIILDSSHEIDYCMYLAGSKVKQVKSIISKYNPLHIQAESMADILLEFENEVTAIIHVDLLQREASRRCKIQMERREMEWRLLSAEKDTCYIEEMKHFAKCCAGEAKADSREAFEVLKVALKAKGELNGVGL